MGKAIITEQELALGCARKERDAQGDCPFWITFQS